MVLTYSRLRVAESSTGSLNGPYWATRVVCSSAGSFPANSCAGHKNCGCHYWTPFPGAGLANCEVDFTQKRLDLSCLGNSFGSGYGEPLVCVLKQVVCILFSYTLHCKEACEIVNCQIFNQPVVGGPRSTKNCGQVELLDGLPIGPG